MFLELLQNVDNVAGCWFRLMMLQKLLVIAGIGCGWRGGCFGIKKLPNIRSMTDRRACNAQKL